jgi:hypothetical protein
MDHPGMVSFTDIRGRVVKRAFCARRGMLRVSLAAVPAGVYVMGMENGSSAPAVRLVAVVR